MLENSICLRRVTCMLVSLLSNSYLAVVINLISDLLHAWCVLCYFLLDSVFQPLHSLLIVISWVSLGVTVDGYYRNQVSFLNTIMYWDTGSSLLLLMTTWRRLHDGRGWKERVKTCIVLQVSCYENFGQVIFLLKTLWQGKD